MCTLESYGEDIQKVKIKLEGIEILVQSSANTQYHVCLEKNFAHLVGDRSVSAVEVPVIEYIFRSLHFPKECHNEKKRILLVDVFGNKIGNTVILFDRCFIEY